MASIRHRWMASRVAEVFGVEADAALSVLVGSTELTSWLEGSSTNNSIYVYYQPRDTRASVRKPVHVFCVIPLGVRCDVALNLSRRVFVRMVRSSPALAPANSLSLMELIRV